MGFAKSLGNDRGFQQLAPDFGGGPFEHRYGRRIEFDDSTGFIDDHDRIRAGAEARCKSRPAIRQLECAGGLCGVQVEDSLGRVPECATHQVPATATENRRNHHVQADHEDIARPNFASREIADSPEHPENHQQNRRDDTSDDRGSRRHQNSQQ